jgi:hypothetical protein
LTLQLTADNSFHDSVLTCGNATFAAVTIAKANLGAGLSIGSGCTLPLGNDAMAQAGSIINNGTINAGSGTLTFDVGQFVLNAGATLSMGGDSLVVYGMATGDGDLILNGGSFPQDITTLTLSGDLTNAADLLPDALTLSLVGHNGFHDTLLDCNNVEWSALTINKTSTGASTTFPASCVVTGDFSRVSGPVSNPATATTLYVGGSVSLSGTHSFGGSNLTVSLVGSGQHLISQSTGVFQSALRIDKPLGSAVLTSSLVLGSTLTVASGALDQGAAANLTTGGTFAIETTGVYRNAGSGDLTLAGDLVNGGAVWLDGGGGSCETADTLLVRSSSAGTQRNMVGFGVVHDVRRRRQGHGGRHHRVFQYRLGEQHMDVRRRRHLDQRSGDRIHLLGRSSDRHRASGLAPILFSHRAGGNGTWRVRGRADSTDKG